MTPPAGPGQRAVLQSHYDRAGAGPVAFVDETYHVEDDGRSRFYVMAAVVVLSSDRDALREELDELVPDGWWHTTDHLRTEDGREYTRELLSAFRVPDETCVIVEKTRVDPDDREGQAARREVLSRLLTSVHTAEHETHPPVNLVVLEEQREARKNNYDRSIRADLINTGAIANTMMLALASPGSEHLLWLPDLVCSAYRQKMLFERDELFGEIERLTHVVQLS